NSGSHRSAIWTVFARHGMGFSAVGIEGSQFTGTRYDAAYDLPPDIQNIQNPTVTSNPLLLHPAFSDPYQYRIVASSPSGAALKYTLTNGPSGMTVDSTTGIVNWTATFVGARVKITVTDGGTGKLVHGYYLPVVTPLKDGAPLVIDGA